MPVNPRPTQTKTKHQILLHYLKSWGGILVNSRRDAARLARQQGRPFELHLVYVDCNASSGRYNGEAEDNISPWVIPGNVWGSPIIGIQQLDEFAAFGRKAGMNVRTNAILIEKNAKEYDELKETLALAGIIPRVRETQDFSSLSSGEIALVHADSTTLGHKLTAYTQASRYTYSLYFLDPYGPKAIPKPFVGEIIRHHRHDVIINLIYYDLHKKSGIAAKPDLSSLEESLAANYDRMFGHSGWRDIARRLLVLPGTAPDEAGTTLEYELSNCYKETLQSVDPTLVIKLMPVQAQGVDRTMLYLFLTTHDPSGALAMNKVIDEGLYEEDTLRQRYEDAKKQTAGQTMFDVSEIRPTRPTRPSTEEIALEIVGKLANKSLSLRDIYREYADSHYFAEEIIKALRFLKATNRADFPPQRPTNDTIICIH